MTLRTVVVSRYGDLLDWGAALGVLRLLLRENVNDGLIFYK